MSRDCYVFKFLQCSEDRKHFMCFQNEISFDVMSTGHSKRIANSIAHMKVNLSFCTIKFFISCSKVIKCVFKFRDEIERRRFILR